MSRAGNSTVWLEFSTPTGYKNPPPLARPPRNGGLAALAEQGFRPDR